MADIANDLGKRFQDVIEAPSKAASSMVDTVKNLPSTIENKVKSYLPKSTKPIATWYEPDANKPAPKTPKASPAKKTPSYEKGTDYVPKTGTAKLHKGEAVLNKDDAETLRMHKKDVIKSASHELAGKEEKPPKEIKHVITKRDKSGKGHIHTHVHTHPEHHPDEDHISIGDDGMVDHMLEHQGTPNPGEAEADAGQSGIPQGAPQAGPQMGPQGAM